MEHIHLTGPDRKDYLQAIYEFYEKKDRLGLSISPLCYMFPHLWKFYMNSGGPSFSTL